MADAESVDPTPEHSGADLLDAVHATLTRYVKFPNWHAEVGVTLWTVATHGIECWNTAPRLVVNSPQKRCGKSRLLRGGTSLRHPRRGWGQQERMNT